MQPIDILLVEDNQGDILLTKEALMDHKIVYNVFGFMMLSTSSSSEDVLKSFNNEANYMTKPMEIDGFIREILSIKNLKISSEFSLNS